MAIRCDMDCYARSCSLVTNFDISVTGGISRRRGFRHLAFCELSSSRLIPYRYSLSETYLVELGETTLHVRRASDAAVIATFTPSEEEPWRYSSLQEVTWQQINSLLLILSPSTPVMQLRCDSAGSWSFSPFAFEVPPWETEEYRRIELTLTPHEGGIYAPSFAPVPDSEEEPTERDTTGDVGDILRASYFTPRKEAFETAATMRNGITTISALTPSSSITAGSKLAWRDASLDTYQYYICNKDFNGNDDFTKGFISPANYPERFEKAENTSGFDAAGVPTIYELTASQSYKKGDKVIFHAGAWNLYTCIRDFDGAQHFRDKTSPDAYPAHFISGIPVGDAIPCAGKWQFYCSGGWYGIYEVRRNYESGALTEQWEHLAESISSVGHQQNNILTGDEEEEECWLRLFVTQLRFTKQNDPGAGWPMDYCNNRLIVYPYRHNMQLTMLADGFMEDTTELQIPLETPLTTTDWSWCAFRSRSGYPRHACIHESRLYFASTDAQPQTIWASKSDDLTDFGTGDLDTSGMLLTMNTTTQAPICWMMSRRDVIMLGTMEAEWIVKASANGSAITPENVRITNQGSTGTAAIPAVSTADHVLYCQRGGGRVFEYGYSYESDGYLSSDLTIFADHIAPAAGGITGGTVMEIPYDRVAFTTGGGSLLLMSYNTMHNVNAWHRYETEGTFQSVCALPNTHAQSDSLFAIVLRSGTRRIEVCDSASGYTDGAEAYDYTSVVETTAFTAADIPEKKDVKAPLQAYFLPPLPPASAMRFSTGGSYQKNNRTDIKEGWNNLVAPSGWKTRPFVGVSCSGNTPCNILALQLGQPIS